MILKKFREINYSPHRSIHILYDYFNDEFDFTDVSQKICERDDLLFSLL